MTNLEKLIKAIAENSYDDLVEFLKEFAYWVDPDGYCDNEMITDYLENDYEDAEDNGVDCMDRLHNWCEDETSL